MKTRRARLDTLAVPERGHSCPQQPRTISGQQRSKSHMSWKAGRPLQQSEPAADRNVRAPVASRPNSARDENFPCFGDSILLAKAITAMDASNRQVEPPLNGRF